MKLYVTYDEIVRGGKPQSDGPYSLREDTYVDFSLKEVSMQENSSFYKEEFEVPEFDIDEPAPGFLRCVYVVLVRYQDGNSFGRRFGNGFIEGVYLTEEAAQKVVLQIMSDTYPKYARWEGYFNRLESVNYHPMMVRKYCSNP